ncbi:helix-turn-helix transcriptional regulator [Streptomyces phaeochromogenes]|nr:helix-turn-helix transcriptional regulator [Streptomyces phaeochromogenes]
MDSHLGRFLMARRAQVTPEERGLPAGPRRRVPGLRREEVALLAGVSVDYYIRLEQGRAETPSLNVLRAVARVLGLGPIAQEHLFRLAQPDREPEPERLVIRRGVTDLLNAMSEVPAFLAGRGQEILYANLLGEALLPSSYPGPTRNAASHVFLSPDARSYYVDWRKVAEETVATLRHEYGKYPGDAFLKNLVAELSAASSEFSELWEQHDVQLKPSGLLRIHHPIAGRLNLNYEFLITGESELIVTFRPAGDTNSEAWALLEDHAKSLRDSS